MELQEELKRIAKRAVDLSASIATEEATKTALILPVLQALGYDVFNPTEVVPEFNADVGIKKGEKVDYAIFNEGKLSILIECKKVGEKLNYNHANQLYRYFAVTDARFGIFTDGIVYSFFSDLDEKNKMDNKPFFVFDLLSHSEADIKEFRKFGKSRYAEESILSAANNLKYARLIDGVLQSEFENPSEDLVKLITGRVYEGRQTAAVIEWMNPLLKEAMQRIIRKKVRANLESALDKGSELDVEPIEEPKEGDGKGVVTTDEEIDAFNIIRAIVAETADPARVFMRDSKSYCAVLFDNNNRKPICRLYLEGKQWRVGTFSNKEEVRHDISELTQIYSLSTAIRETVTTYIGDSE